jgi:hypothetical protein
MSSPPLADQLDAVSDVVEHSLVELLTKPVKRLAFYAAIVLPFLHLPLLVTGLQSETVTVAFGTLLALNVVAILVGHYYDE